MTSSDNSSRNNSPTIDRDLSFKPRTEYGNAERLVARHGHDLRYCTPLKAWFVWDGRRWKLDDSGEVMRRAKATVRAIKKEADAADDDGMRSDLRKWKARSEAKAALNAMISLAASEFPVVISPDQLDTDPWKLNILNGTIDLRTGGLGSHDRADLITLLAPVEYDPEADAPLWRSFLERIFDGNTDVHDYVQRAVGYSISGDVSEQVLFMPYGTGNNGKSTMLKSIQAMLGDYAQQAESATFLTRNYDRIPNDLAALRGARFVPAVEIKSGRSLDEALVKQVTGGDRLRARFLHREWFEYSPVMKVWLAVNHKPEIGGQDPAIWRRIRLIPFAVEISAHERDKHMDTKLAGELSGILNWSLHGCRQWQEHGLDEPADVIMATGAYREEMDELLEFLEDMCVRDDGLSILKGELFGVYEGWAGPSKAETLSKRKFGSMLRERGFREGRDKRGNRMWLGITTKAQVKGAAKLEEAREELIEKGTKPPEF